MLTYQYNTGGQMSTVQGKKGSYDYHYVQQLHYDKFEQRTYLLYGNNTETRYVYDPFDRRLAHLTAGKGAGSLFMDLSYEYDRVGNITELANAAEVNSPNMMGGKTSFSYQYDDLYRLTDSTGTFDTKPDKQHAYTLSMQYDTIHNIKQKTQLHTLRQPGGQKITQQKTSYDWAYQYDGQQPHAPTHLGDRTFSYDANGNQLGWTHDKNGTRRTITWDEENRIQNIQDNGHTFTYTYDGSGQRMTKRGPQGETGYINQWMTLRNGEVGTKHVFVGTTRVVSKLVKQDKPNSKRNSGGDGTSKGKGQARIVYEKDQYYFHPDHLGTTAYITHTNGQVYQHLEYFPFGETWVEEHSNKQRTPYQFTGKELDEETGLYYFGARYYDPRMSIWTSTDPILSQYLNGERSDGGVFKPHNIGLYGYSHHNPTSFLDPDGREVTAAEVIKIKSQYRAMINGARSKGYRLAPMALENFMNTKSQQNPLMVDPEIVRSFPEVLNAEIKNYDRFNQQVEAFGKSLKPGESGSFSDHWDAQIYGESGDLFYGSGNSTLTSTGDFSVSKSPDGRANATGQIVHEWKDTYDWHDGLSVEIPFLGSSITIGDSDGNKLIEAGEARAFEMRSTWKENY